MEINKKELKADILKLAFDLEKQYADLNFKHHCYLRIAYDAVAEDKWNNIIKSPFLNNCSLEELETVCSLLDCYTVNKNMLLKHNNYSLNYRKNEN